MRGGPVYAYRLPHRRPGVFGASAPGRLFEWLTSTWFRLEVTILWLVLIPVILSGHWPNSLSQIFAFVVSPVLAVFTLLVLKIVGWLIYFIPGLNAVWGWSRIAFLWSLSRLVVEEAPEIEIPAWSRT